MRKSLFVNRIPAESYAVLAAVHIEERLQPRQAAWVATKVAPTGGNLSQGDGFVTWDAENYMALQSVS